MSCNNGLKLYCAFYDINGWDGCSVSNPKYHNLMYNVVLTYTMVSNLHLWVSTQFVQCAGAEF